MYIYESHLGGLYEAVDELDYDALYCEECGDSDWCEGYFDSWEEYIKTRDPNTFFYSPEYLSELTGIPLEKVLELNPKLAEEYNMEEGEENE